MRLTRYTLETPRLTAPVRVAVIADLHDRPYDELLILLYDIAPDLILLPGDITGRLDAPPDTPRPGLGLLADAAAIAPTVYALGNHEVGGSHEHLRRRPAGGGKPPFVMSPHFQSVIDRSGALLLDNTWRTVTLRNGNRLAIGGLGSGLIYPDRAPRTAWLRDFAAAPLPRILLCHHPEYHPAYIAPLGLDLTVAGHAHGGQWRFFGRGVYAPDQGIFPRYTSGIHRGNLIISRGVVNSVPPIPRLFNPPEVLEITLTPGRG